MDKYKGECDYKRCMDIMDEIQRKYSFVNRQIIAKTDTGRKIELLSVKNSNNGLLVCGAFHGMERITSALILDFFEKICEKARREQKFADKLSVAGLSVVPMVNPDGVEISMHSANSAKQKKEFVKDILDKSKTDSKYWQANVNGVDINHNFDADFEKVKKNEREMGIYYPSPTRYGGRYPHSEKESQALVKLCENNCYDIAVALHSQGREIYYDFSDYTPQNSFVLAQKMSALSGYKVGYPKGIAVGGGFKDYFIYKYRRPAFTIEVGKGENPLDYNDFYKERGKVNMMLGFLLRYIHTKENSDAKHRC